MMMNTHTNTPRLATRFSYKAKREISSDVGLTERELRDAVPSIFAEGAHESRSARYTYIPTWEVLRGLMGEGFQVFSATTAIPRVEDKQGYCKHMLRLRHGGHGAQGTNQYKDVNELILINSHDGGSSYQLMAGCFTFVCSNGTICGDTYGEVRVRHSGNVQQEVIQGAFEVVDSFAKVDESKDTMKSLQLTDGEQKVFARAALALRFPDKDPGAIDVRAEQVNEARRWSQRDESLWSTFQRSQENLVRGGLRTHGRRRAHTRAVTGIDGNVALNRALWTLAEGMAHLKQGIAA